MNINNLIESICPFQHQLVFLNDWIQKKALFESIHIVRYILNKFYRWNLYVIYCKEYLFILIVNLTAMCIDCFDFLWNMGIFNDCLYTAFCIYTVTIQREMQIKDNNLGKQSYG